jgi:SAM-dependent MidA family methyltransferase
MTPRTRPTILPPLTALEAHHMGQVAAAVRAQIEHSGGWIDFADYLRTVLYAPGLGYYSAGAAKFGAQGDFVTAPELSELFGRCVARQCAQVLTSTPGDVLELGAGSGRLAATVLTALAADDALPRHYYILEVSADLRARQRALLAQLPAALAARVQWLDALPPQPLSGVVLANEVADALPFTRFAVAQGGFHARGVALGGDGEFIDADRSAPPALRVELERLSAGLPQPFADGYVSELCTLLNPWIASLGAALADGIILLLDYGLPRGEYYHAQRSSGTLRCHFRQRAHDDPFVYPGLQDITAWVDFTRVAEAAADANLAVAGYCTQTAFLLATGIEAAVAAAATDRARAHLASQARQLLLPGEMGENFKVMALTRDFPAPLIGFAYQDLRRLL